MDNEVRVTVSVDVSGQDELTYCELSLFASPFSL